MGLFHPDGVRGKEVLYLAECWFSSLSRAAFVACIVYRQKRKLEKQAHKKTVSKKGTENNVAKATFSWFPKILKKKKIPENISHTFFKKNNKHYFLSINLEFALP